MQVLLSVVNSLIYGCSMDEDHGELDWLNPYYKESCLMVLPTIDLS